MLTIGAAATPAVAGSAGLKSRLFVFFWKTSKMTFRAVEEGDVRADVHLAVLLPLQIRVAQRRLAEARLELEFDPAMS